MTYDTIEITRDGHVATIALDRAEKFNTFSTTLSRELIEALESVDEDDEVRAVVVEGNGGVLSAGIDLNEHDDFETHREYFDWVEEMERPFRVLTDMRTPVIVGVEGHAAANGLGLVAAADLAVAASDAQMGMTAVNVGLFCTGPGVPLIRTVTEKQALELLLTGELIGAETAKDWGLVNRVVEPDAVHEEAMALADTIASKSPVAVQKGKEAFYEAADLEFDKAMNVANEAFATICRTEDAAEGIEAFLEDREPEYEGR